MQESASSIYAQRLSQTLVYRRSPWLLKTGS